MYSLTCMMSLITSKAGESKFFWTDFVSVKSINYTCVVKNDTPLICTVGVKVQMGCEYLRERVVVKS